jgi:trehalose/maltose hydrolase-like predicted phosphorylase
VLKLKSDDTDISRERLEAWLNKGQGEFSEYSIKGALDADEYHDEVNGEFDNLKLSYEWAWLRERFEQL